jgi:hypothetical protein
MKFGASAWISAQREATESVESTGGHDSLRPAPRRFGLGSLFIGRPLSAESRPKSRWMVMLLVGAAALFFMTWKSDPKPSNAIELTKTPAELALQEGLAWLESPRGAQTGRPRVLNILLPGGVERFRLLLVDAGGVVLLNEEHRAGESGVLAVDEGTHQRVLVPFPSSDVLPLSENASVGWSILLPGGRIAGGARFHLSSPSQR